LLALRLQCCAVVGPGFGHPAQRQYRDESRHDPHDLKMLTRACPLGPSGPVPSESGHMSGMTRP
jgi:hypothetical protein